MILENYTCVKLLSNRYISEGAKYGDIGSIIEVYDNDEYEVEFSGTDDISFAQIVAEGKELESYSLTQKSEN